ncbi:hypothetical protein N0V95_002458 [Ascochyta clinopodiicola]|nr:hypothetical protein N0V95_002458 [Ascochyta clinopodiicola]
MKVTAILLLLLLLALVVVVLPGGSQDDRSMAFGHEDDHAVLAASAAALFAQYLEDLRVYPYALNNVNEDLVEDLRDLFRRARRPASRRPGGFTVPCPTTHETEILAELAALKSKLGVAVYIGFGSLALSFLGGLAGWLSLGFQQSWIPSGA